MHFPAPGFGAILPGKPAGMLPGGARPYPGARPQAARIDRYHLRTAVLIEHRIAVGWLIDPVTCWTGSRAGATAWSYEVGPAFEYIGGG